MNTPTDIHVLAALSAIDEAVDAGEPSPTLEQLARAARVAPGTLRDDFRHHTGLTPKAYADARRAARLRDALASDAPVSEALYSAGYTSTSRVYERHGELLGMTPAAYRKGAPGESIRYAFAESSLGLTIVGLTPRGVCLIAFGDSREELLADLRARFPKASLEPAHARDAELVRRVIALVDDPKRGAALPLDVRGTAFQQLVWTALTRIEPGETVTYGELARRIGRPTATRAVAAACGANPLAVAVPCHRVIGADGTLTGYRWGVERKRALLERESA